MKITVRCPNCLYPIERDWFNITDIFCINCNIYYELELEISENYGVKVWLHDKE